MERAAVRGADGAPAEDEAVTEDEGGHDTQAEARAEVVRHSAAGHGHRDLDHSAALVHHLQLKHRRVVLRSRRGQAVAPSPGGGRGRGVSARWPPTNERTRTHAHTLIDAWARFMAEKDVPSSPNHATSAGPRSAGTRTPAPGGQRRPGLGSGCGETFGGRGWGAHRPARRGDPEHGLQPAHAGGHGVAPLPERGLPPPNREGLGWATLLALLEGSGFARCGGGGLHGV